MANEVAQVKRLEKIWSTIVQDSPDTILFADDENIWWLVTDSLYIYGDISYFENKKFEIEVFEGDGRWVLVFKDGKKEVSVDVKGFFHVEDSFGLN